MEQTPEEKLSPQEFIYIKMAIDHYNRLYLPAATEKGIRKMSEKEYVELALENLAEFEAHLAQCELFGHKNEVVHLGEVEIKACSRCGLTDDLAEIFIKTLK